MRLTASQRLYGLGAMLLGALAVCSRNFNRAGEPLFLIPLGLAALVYLLALRELFLTPNLPRRVVFFGLLLAALWHGLFLQRPPGLDDDIHRYLWDGRVQRLGYNPYTLVPGDPTHAALHTPETRTLNNPEVPSPYPPGAQLFFRAVTAIRESVMALKVAFVVCEAAMVFVLLDLLRRTGRGEHWILAFAWHPLLAIEVAGSGHVDVLGALLLVCSAAALIRRWQTLAAVCLGLAVAVKFLPIVLLPVYWRRIRVRDITLTAAIVALLYLPFLNHGRIPLGSLGTYVQRFRFNDPLFAVLERVMTPQIAVALAVLAGFFVAAWMRRRSRQWSPEAFAWPMATSLFCAPVVYPWYLVWLLPWVPSISTLPILIWTLSIIPTYYVWHLRTVGRAWSVPDWIVLLEYGSVAAAAATVALFRSSRSAAFDCAADQAE